MQPLVQFAEDYYEGLLTLEEWHYKTVTYIVELQDGVKEALAAYLKDYNIKRGA